MDRVPDKVINALEQVICCSEGLLDVQIEQDTSKEILIIQDLNHELKTIMNCKMNSVGATIRQVCNHINKRDLFSYEPNYMIGC